MLNEMRLKIKANEIVELLQNLVSFNELKYLPVEFWWNGTLFTATSIGSNPERSEEHTSELQSHSDLVCRLLLEKKKNNRIYICRMDTVCCFVIVREAWRSD